MKRLIYATALSASLATGLGMTVLSVPASADTTTTQSCQGVDTSTANGNCADSKISSSKTEVLDASYAAVSTKGKIVVRWNMASGIKLRNSDTKGMCNTKHPKLYRSFSKVPRGATCFLAAKGFKFINSGILLSTGKFAEWQDVVRTTWMRFVKHGSQWYKAGDSTGHGNCGNKVRFFGHQPKRTFRQVIIVRSAENWDFNGHVAVQSSAIAAALAKAWCNTTNSSAFATGNGNGSASGSASASYRLHGLSQVKAWVSAQQASLQQSNLLKVSAEAQAASVSAAIASAQAQVSCSSSSPPSQQPPSIIDYTSLNDLDAGQSTQPCGFFAKVFVPSPDTGTVFFASNTGSFNVSQFSVGSGTTQVCATYTAPSDASTSSDTVTVTVIDNVTNLKAVVTQTVQVRHPVRT